MHPPLVFSDAASRTGSYGVAGAWAFPPLVGASVASVSLDSLMIYSGQGSLYIISDEYIIYTADSDEADKMALREVETVWSRRRP